MQELVWSVEIVAGLVLLGIALFLLGTYWRRRVLAREGALSVCALRRAGETEWRPCLLRYGYGTGRLDLFGLGGFSMRPRHSWRRADVELGSPQAPAEDDRFVLLPEAVRVPLEVLGADTGHAARGGLRPQAGSGDQTGSGSLELALTRDAYWALRSWAESAPPGVDARA